jgi:DNA-binding GntR family transcriptional regulator
VRKEHQAASVQESVYTALRKIIITLNLLPGTAISEKEISLKYGVSRTPVREAFIRLSQEGLVRVIPQRETLVSLIDFKRVQQEFFLREQLELAIVELFISRGKDTDFSELETLLEKQERAAEKSEYINFIHYDDAFHHTLFEVADQYLAWEVLETMSGHYYRVRLLSVWISGIAKNVIREHRDILSALKRKNLEEARSLLTAHLPELDNEGPLLRERFPDYFVSDETQNHFEVDFGGLSL